MHELSIATGVMDTVVNVASQNDAIAVNKINLTVGTSTAVIEEALRGAFDALKELKEYELCKNAQVNVTMEESTSICLDCGEEFTHGIAAAQCPNCYSYKTELMSGRDVFISAIEVENADKEE